MNSKKTIVITMQDGLIQHIGGIPEDVVISLRDYDVEGADPALLKGDENGEPYFEIVWKKDGFMPIRPQRP